MIYTYVYVVRFNLHFIDSIYRSEEKAQDRVKELNLRDGTGMWSVEEWKVQG